MIGLLADSQVVRELLAEHPSSGRLRGAGWGEKRLDRLFRLSAEDIQRAEEAESPFAIYDYDQAFAGAEQSLEAMLGSERPPETAPETLLEELLQFAEDEQCRLAADEPRFAHPSVVRALIERSHRLRFAADPKRMAHLANLSCLVAGACSADAAGNERRLADLRASGWMQYGNALRVSGKLRQAAEALAAAQRHCDVGTHDPLVRAGLLEKLISLRIYESRLDEAMKLATEAEAVYRDLGEHHSLAGTLVQKAIVWLRQGKPAAAIRLLKRAMPLIDQDKDPLLFLAAVHNHIRSHIDLERIEEALALHSEARDLYKKVLDPLLRLRTGWQEGQLLRDLGQLEAAEAALLQARQGFLDQRLPKETALISLDLIELYRRAGDVGALKRFVADTIPILQELGVDREAVAALLQLLHHFLHPS